jgi:hypothetical protein
MPIQTPEPIAAAHLPIVLLLGESQPFADDATYQRALPFFKAGAAIFPMGPMT